MRAMFLREISMLARWTEASRVGSAVAAAVVIAEGRARAKSEETCLLRQSITSNLLGGSVEDETFTRVGVTCISPGTTLISHSRRSNMRTG